MFDSNRFLITTIYQVKIFCLSSNSRENMLKTCIFGQFSYLNFPQRKTSQPASSILISKTTCSGLYSAYSSLKSWSWWLTQSSQRPSTIACPIAIACALNQDQEKWKLLKVRIILRVQNETKKIWLNFFPFWSELEFQIVHGWVRDKRETWN